MLAGLLGIRLVLWMGRSIPRPAPSALLDSLVSVEVHNDAQAGDGFSITFNVTKDGDDYEAIRGGALEPGVRVWIGVAMGVTPEPLIDGIITMVQLSPSQEPGHSTVTVTGSDVSVMMSLEEHVQPYQNQADTTIFSQIIGTYGQYSMTPVTPETTEVRNQTDGNTQQRQTDLAFINTMARRNGFVFFVEPQSFGSNRAYFGPAPRGGPPQPALTINMGGDSNLTQLSFNSDSLAAVGASSRIINRQGRTSVRIPNTPVVRVPPMAARPAMPLRVIELRSAARRQPQEAVRDAIAHVMRQPDPNNCHGTIDGVRYGTVLRARRPVGLRGAGRSNNGDWLVKRVDHHIQRGSYTQTFRLSREGMGAISPMVRT